ncbi:type II toxin-antitoxin system HigB family toxin [bacterium]|nr:type II toxin-antitoxin system HigB family toxin [bacterium]
MRTISLRRLKEYWEVYAATEAPLKHWYRITNAAQWTTLNDVRATFPNADRVTVGSERSVVVFNVGKTGHRLITAVHYNTQLVFVLRLVHHDEYERGRWKDEL